MIGVLCFIVAVLILVIVVLVHSIKEMVTVFIGGLSDVGYDITAYHQQTKNHLDYVQGDINLLRLQLGDGLPPGLSDSELKIKLGLQAKDDRRGVVADRKRRWSEKYG